MEQPPKPQQTGIQFLDILLIESGFKHLSLESSSEQQQSALNISLESNVEEEEGRLFCTLSIEVKVSNESEEIANIQAAMMGVFQFDPKSGIPLEYFRNVNGPAIIFPFIREHIVSLSQKGRLQQVLLPPINFVRMYELQKKQNEEAKK